MEFSVPKMSCGHCVATIEKAITEADPAAEVSCDLDSHKVTVDTDLTATEAEAAMERAGYPAELVAA